jgi:16S rRNA processing protein RimM
VLRAHGLRGELQLQLFRPRRETSSGRVRQGEIVLVEPSGRVAPHVLESVRWTAPASAVVRLTGVSDRNAAEGLIGAFVEIDPKSPPDRLTDAADPLIDAQVRDVESGRALGRVIAIQDNGAQSILVVGRDGGASEGLIPFVEAFIAGLESEDGETVVLIRAIPGLLDDEVEGSS